MATNRMRTIVEACNRHLHEIAGECPGIGRYWGTDLMRHHQARSFRDLTISDIERWGEDDETDQF